MINLSMNIVLLVSIINTYLRNKYSSLEDLCFNEDLEIGALNNILLTNDYFYDSKINQIKQK